MRRAAFCVNCKIYQIMEELFNKLLDLLKLMIEDAVNKALSEKVPYPPAPITVNNKKILTRKQAAEYLQVQPATVTRYVKQGLLLPAMIHGKYRFFEKDLIKLLSIKAS